MNKTERRAAPQRERRPPQSPEVYQATAVYQGMRYRASDAPSQSTTNTDHYLEIVDIPEQTDQESTGDNDHYDMPELYEGLVTTAAIHRELPPTPPVYEGLAH